MKDIFLNFASLFNKAAEKGMLLLSACALAMLMVNTNYATHYNTITQSALIHFGDIHVSLLHLTNDFLMAIFFFLVGLEIKREMLVGNLATNAKRLLPIVAAIGGIIGPLVIYVILNHHDEIALRGWAIPAATDIAFALGIFALFGKGLPIGLRIFLTALAIVDDLIAVILIALFYSNGIATFYLALAVSLCMIFISIHEISLFWKTIVHNIRLIIMVFSINVWSSCNNCWRYAWYAYSISKQERKFLLAWLF